MRCFSSSLRAASSLALALILFQQQRPIQSRLRQRFIRFVLKLRLLILGSIAAAWDFRVST